MVTNGKCHQLQPRKQTTAAAPVASCCWGGFALNTCEDPGAWERPLTGLRGWEEELCCQVTVRRASENPKQHGTTSTPHTHATPHHGDRKTQAQAPEPSDGLTLKRKCALSILLPGLPDDREFSETFIKGGRKGSWCLASILILILPKSWAKCKSNISRFFRTSRWPRGVEGVGSRWWLHWGGVGERMLRAVYLVVNQPGLGWNPCAPLPALGDLSGPPFPHL